MRTTLLSVLVFTVGCAHHPEKGEQHPEMGGAVKLFHDVISPVYHLEAGAPRDEQACAAVPKLKDASTAVTAEVADKAKTEALAQAVSGLDTACQATGRAEVAAKLETLHDAFHAVMEAAH